MKDESKAKWPELTCRVNKATAIMPGNQVWYVDAPLNIMFTIVAPAIEAEARSKQIAALPDMVALLKILHADELIIRAGYDSQVYEILRDIGEVE